MEQVTQQPRLPGYIVRDTSLPIHITHPAAARFILVTLGLYVSLSGFTELVDKRAHPLKQS